MNNVTVHSVRTVQCPLKRTA